MFLFCLDINFKENLFKTKSLPRQFGDLLDNFSRHYFFSTCMVTTTVAAWSAEFCVMRKGDWQIVIIKICFALSKSNSESGARELQLSSDSLTVCF